MKCSDGQKVGNRERDRDAVNFLPLNFINYFSHNYLTFFASRYSIITNKIQGTVRLQAQYGTLPAKSKARGLWPQKPTRSTKLTKRSKGIKRSNIYALCQSAQWKWECQAGQWCHLAWVTTENPTNGRLRLGTVRTLK